MRPLFALLSFWAAAGHLGTSGSLLIPLLTFEANRGQAGEGADFLARGPGYTAWLARGEIVMALGAGDSPQRVVSLKWAGGRAKPAARGLEPLAARSHYLIGSDPAAWRRNIPHYGRVLYEDVYPGIDAVYYGGRQGLEYDLILEPGADPDQIRLAFEGVERVEVDGDGDLLLHTGAGVLRQLKPRVYQQADGGRREVPGEYVLRAGAEAAFRLGQYDRSEPLVIDPVLRFATLFGGSGLDQAAAIATDQSGYIHIAGVTNSPNLATRGPIQGSFQGGDLDAFVAKFDPQGRNLIYATYLGGNDRDQANGLAVDAAGNACVGGSTRSANFPTTAGALQRTFAGGTVDGFVAKLNPEGSGFVYSTYLGGPSPEALTRLRIDAAGNVYVLGNITATGFPTTPGVVQPAFAGSFDALLAKLDPSGSRLLYATYLGGARQDSTQDLRVNEQGEAYVLLTSDSPGLPTTANAFQRQHRGMTDAVVAKLNASATAILYLSYLGGSRNEVARGMALDAAGNVWLTGATDSTDLPVTADATQQTFGGGLEDTFLARLPVGTSQTAALSDEGGPRPEQFPSPFITFSGDGNRNQGLAVFVTPFGIVFVSESSSGPDCEGRTAVGTFGKIFERDARTGRILGPARCIRNGDFFDLDGTLDGNVAGAGVGLAASQSTPGAPETTPGAHQPNHAGGADAYVGVFGPSGPALKIQKHLVGIFDPVTNQPKDLERTDSLLAPVAGDLGVFLIRVTNVGQETARNVVIGDSLVGNFGDRLVRVLPPTVPLPSDVVPSPFPCQGLPCTLGDLPPGKSFAVEVGWTLARRPNFTRNRATAEATGVPEVTDSVQLQRVLGKVNLQITKSVRFVVRPRPFREGELVDYEVVVTNFGSDDAFLATIQDNLSGAVVQDIMTIDPKPPDFSAKVEGAKCGARPTGFDCTVLRFPISGKLTIQMRARVVGPSPVVNQAAAFAVNADRVTAATSNDVGSQDQPPNRATCTPQVGLPALLDQFSTTARLPDITLDCASPFAGLVNVQLFLNRPITSRTHPDGTTDATLVVGDPPHGTQVLAPPGDTSGRPNVFQATRASDNSIVWLGVPVNAPGTQGARVYRMKNVRAAIDGSLIPSLAQVLGQVPILGPIGEVQGQLSVTPASAEDPILTNPIPNFVMGISTPVPPNRSRAGGAPSTSFTIGNQRITVDVTEPFLEAFLKRIETNGGPEPLGTPRLQDDPVLNYGTASGFTPFVPGVTIGGHGAPGVADTGTRLIFRVSNATAGTVLTVPECIDSQATSRTGSGGNMQVRRVTNFDPNYAGGTLNRTCGPPSNLPVTQGAATIVYEVVGPSGVNGTDVTDRYRMNFGVSCPPGAQGTGRAEFGVGPFDTGQTPQPIPGYRPAFQSGGFNWVEVCR